VIEKGKPLDKSVKSAITTAESDWLVGLLLIPRGGADDVDARGDTDPAVGKPREQAPSGGGVTVGNFGHAKRAAVVDLDEEQLGWYRQAYARDVADPDKHDFLDRNQKILDAIVAETKRRHAGQEPPPASGLPADPVFILPAQRRKLFSLCAVAAATASDRTITEEEAEDVKAILKAEIGAAGYGTSDKIQRADFDAFVKRATAAVAKAFAPGDGPADL
jgi:hypothetical protein